MISRNPTDRRPPNSAPLELHSLDEAFLRQLRRHRFMTAAQLARITGEPEGRVLRRLPVLLDHGYLARPEAQWRREESLRGRDLVYGLAKRGVRHLQSIGEVASHRIHEKRVGQFYLDHTVGVAEFMTRLERELPPGVLLEYLDEDGSRQRTVTSCSWTVPVRYRGESLEIGVVPDRVFRLSVRDESLVFCLEVDRGTMPVVRTNPGQTSFYRKLLAYHETWRSGIHRRHLGWQRFRVLTVTSSEERRDHLVEVCKEVVASGGSGLFLFSDLKSCAAAHSVAAMPWVTGDGRHLAKLLTDASG